jgi:cell division protein FtsB
MARKMLRYLASRIETVLKAPVRPLTVRLTQLATSVERLEAEVRSLETQLDGLKQRVVELETQMSAQEQVLTDISRRVPYLVSQAAERDRDDARPGRLLH